MTVVMISIVQSLSSQEKQDRELIVAQIMNSFLQTQT